MVTHPLIGITTYFSNNCGDSVCDEVLSRIQTANDIGHFHLENTATLDTVSSDKRISSASLYIDASTVNSAPHPHDLLVKTLLAVHDW